MAAARRSSGPVLRSNSSLNYPYYSTLKTSFSSSFPSRLNLNRYVTPSVTFSLDRSASPNRSGYVSSAPVQERSCMCSPTTHPGSFRCSLHKKGLTNISRVSTNSKTLLCESSRRLNMIRRSTMTNSLVRIGTVEGNLVNRALAALIRPSCHQQRRPADFRPRRSRLSVMSNADDGS